MRSALSGSQSDSVLILLVEDDLAHAMELLQKHGAIAKGLDLAKTYGRKAQQALTAAPDGDLRRLLDDIVSFTIEREY